MSICKILVCTHMDAYMPQSDIFLPIQVGKIISPFSLPIQGDDIGENISKKNRSYCELTGLYWAWKNLKKVDYIGLCHYRRYFYLNASYFLSKGEYIVSVGEFTNSDFKFPDINKLFQKYDIVLPKQKSYPYSLKIDYCSSHISEDYRILKQVINDLTPEYIEAFKKVMESNNKLAHYNMFITGWKHFDHYCQWLFKILGEVENRTDISNYSQFQARIYGYMSERLLNVYVEKHQLRVKHCPIIWVNDNVKDKGLLHYHLKRLASSLAFFFGRS